MSKVRKRFADYRFRFRVLGFRGFHYGFRFQDLGFNALTVSQALRAMQVERREAQMTGKTPSPPGSAAGGAWGVGAAGQARQGRRAAGGVSTREELRLWQQGEGHEVEEEEGGGNYSWPRGGGPASEALLLAAETPLARRCSTGSAALAMAPARSASCDSPTSKRGLDKPASGRGLDGPASGPPELVRHTSAADVLQSPKGQLSPFFNALGLLHAPDIRSHHTAVSQDEAWGVSSSGPAGQGTPYILHPCTLHPTPYIHPTPYTLHPTT